MIDAFQYSKCSLILLLVFFQIDFYPRFVIKMAFQQRGISTPSYVYPAPNVPQWFAWCAYPLSGWPSTGTHPSFSLLTDEVWELIQLFTNCHLSALLSLILYLPSRHLVELAEAPVLAQNKVFPLIVKISFETNTSLMNNLFNLSCSNIFIWLFIVLCYRGNRAAAPIDISGFWDWIERHFGIYTSPK